MATQLRSIINDQIEVMREAGISVIALPCHGTMRWCGHSICFLKTESCHHRAKLKILKAGFNKKNPVTSSTPQGLFRYSGCASHYLFHALVLWYANQPNQLRNGMKCKCASADCVPLRIDKCPTPGQRFSDKFPAART